MKFTFHLNNPILNVAKSAAGNIIMNKYRLMALLNQLEKKINGLEDKRNATTAVTEKVFVMGRLLKALTTRRYKSLPWKATISIIAAMLYFVNPADIIPDFVPLTGLLDDFSILIWTYNSLQAELEKFLEWEKSDFPLQ
ncbi:MAG: DUF1232 domain-containing protein [Cyclobacteriaceae bacterium]|nr:DUF1232 domain-containing protein [Cyclobacteriaceae bacterium]